MDASGENASELKLKPEMGRLEKVRALEKICQFGST